MSMQKSLNLEELLAEGFSRKYATYYIKHAEAEFKNPLYDADYIRWAHSKGFLAESAYAYNLNEDNVRQFLSDYDYYKIWPLNNWSRIWVNDKLTLKLMLSDPELKGFMPEYYYYSIDSTLKPLSDLPICMKDSEDLVSDFFMLLRDKGDLACKPCNGTTSVGFARISYKNKKFFINNKEVSEDNIRSFIKENTNFIFTEYIIPSKEFSVYSPKIHTLRIVVINEHGNDPRIIGGYLRLPCNNQTEANYTVLDGTNNEMFNIFTEVDFQNGRYGNAKLTYSNNVMDAKAHPDTHVPMEGVIRDYEKLKEYVYFVARKFSNLEFIGFDIGITTNGFKCMEINTHPGIKYMQIFNPFFSDAYLKKYFEKKIMQIDMLTAEEKSIRNDILR